MGLQKNVTGQKWRVFAFNITTNAKVTGDAANITAKIAKDWGAATALGDVNPTETEDGYYVFDLTQAETNAAWLDLYPESSTANVQVVGVPGSQGTVPANFPVMGIESDGMAHADLKEWLGSAPNALVSGRLDASVGAMAANTLTDTAIAASALTELRTYLHGADVAAQMDASGYIKISDGTGTGQIDLTSGKVSALLAAADVTGNLPAVLADAAHGGTAAVLTLERIVVASTTTNEPAIKATGNGSGAALRLIAGASGHAVEASATAAAKFGFFGTGSGVGGGGYSGTGTHATGIGGSFTGGSSSIGIVASGGITGLSLQSTGVSSGALRITAASGDAIYIDGAGGDDIRLVNSDAPTLRDAILTADSLTSTVLATSFVEEIRNAITGGAYALSSDANGRLRIVDGTGPGEIDTASGRVPITEAQIDQLVDEIWDEPLAGHLSAGSVGQSVNRIRAAVFDSATRVLNVLTLADGSTQTIDANGRTTVAA